MHNEELYMQVKSTSSWQAARQWFSLISLFLLPLNLSHPLGESEFNQLELRFIIEVAR